jgi:cyclic dehypoxanthinyl futalosine synthase
VSMVTGFGETIGDRVEHLLALRHQQERGLERYGSGFAAFKVWPARLTPTRLNGKIKEPSPEEIARDYLREVAIARLALDNIDNHRAVWRTMGFGVAAQALRAGANDLCGTGSINAINAAMTASGKQLPDPNRALLGQVERCITEAGFTAALRDAGYRLLGRVPLAESHAV